LTWGILQKKTKTRREGKGGQGIRGTEVPSVVKRQSAGAQMWGLDAKFPEDEKKFQNLRYRISNFGTKYL